MPRFTGSTAVPTTTEPYVSGTLMADLADRIVGLIFSDVAGTLFIEQSANGGANWDLSTSIAVVAGTGRGFSEELLAPYYRIRFVPTSNGAAFRIAARTSSAGTR